MHIDIQRAWARRDQLPNVECQQSNCHQASNMNIVDPTPHRSLEDHIALLKAQLEQTQRLAAIGELTSTATHEFNNLLMSILNYAKLGLRHRDDTSRDRAFEKILDASNRATKVVNSVLGMARNRSGEMEPTDLAPVIRDALVLLEREMRKYRIIVESQIEETPLVMASGNEIQRVLLNLLTNARQALRQGGTIRVRLHHDREASSVVLTVRDDGCGIPSEHLAKIFDPFFTTKSGPDASGKGGTGLGLSVCREIIERHHGKIRVESAPNKGTAFLIRLPVAPLPTPSDLQPMASLAPGFVASD
jgi:signal transduction histidine kinase